MKTGKLIVVETLAAHDRAAIFACDVVAFNLHTGVMTNRLTVFPGIIEQTYKAEDDYEREIDIDYLPAVIRRITKQSYLHRQGGSSDHTLAQIADLFQYQIWEADAKLFWWNCSKSYPAIRSFLSQHGRIHGHEDLEEVIDVNSYIRKGKELIPPRLDDEDQMYQVINLIAQEHMPDGDEPTGKKELVQL